MRIRFLLTLACAFGVEATVALAADEPADFRASLRSCAALTSEDARLRCYDQLAGSVAAGEATSASIATPAARPGSGETSVSAPPPVAREKTAEEEFGARGKVARAIDEKRGATEPQPLERLDARVRKVARQPRGELIIELDNGQIWEQKEPKPEIYLEAGDAVTISPGAFSSFWLRAHSKRVRVGRVR